MAAPEVEMDVAAEVGSERDPNNKAIIRKMAGAVITEVCPVPCTIRDLKLAISEQTGTPFLLQQLIPFGGLDVHGDDDELEDKTVEIMMVVEESNMWAWDCENNPAREYIEIDGPHARCPRMRCDFVNVITKEPIRNGRHYFEFVMHHIGDEQSCGVVSDPTHAGNCVSLRSIKGWTYYSGRVRRQGTGSLRDGKGALHAAGRAVTEFKALAMNDDVIGMLVDMDQAAIAFSLNSELQGACGIRVDSPLYLFTALDTPKDHVELRKPNIYEAPPSHLEALSGALLDISRGEALNGWMSDSDSHVTVGLD